MNKPLADDELTGNLRASNAQIESLKDQNVYLQRSQEIDQLACATVKASLASLQEEVADLQEQVAFYRGIVSPDASRAGVRVYDFKIYPTATPGGQTGTHRLSELVLSGERNLVFSFKYFEEFGGEFRLPGGFQPTRAVVAVLPDGGAVPKIEDEYEWSHIQGT